MKVNVIIRTEPRYKGADFRKLFIPMSPRREILTARSYLELKMALFLFHRGGRALGMPIIGSVIKNSLCQADQSPTFVSKTAF